MFRRILVPLDGSDNAEKALPWVERYAGPDKALAFLLRVVPAAPDVAGEAVDEAIAQAEDYVARVERALNRAGIPTKTLVETGHPSTVIVNAADEHRCDAIVMTTRGGSPVARWLIGGTADQVLRLSEVPVLSVRSKMPLPRQGRVRRVLVPLDGSDAGHAVLAHAEALARFHRAAMVLLHVAPERPAFKKRAEERVEHISGRAMRWCVAADRRGMRARFRLAHGDPAATILASAPEQTLIVMTTHGYSGLRRWVFGSVAEKVIREANAPVYVYRVASKAIERRPRALEASHA